jgi:hypothetical protein
MVDEHRLGPYILQERLTGDIYANCQHVPFFAKRRHSIAYGVKRYSLLLPFSVCIVAK